MVTVDLDEIIHEEIEQIQIDFAKQTGEKPSKEEVIKATLKQKPKDQILAELLHEKKKKKRRKKKSGLSEFDQLFGL